jgi:hypothetical protein
MHLHSATRFVEIGSGEQHPPLPLYTAGKPMAILLDKILSCAAFTNNLG